MRERLHIVALSDTHGRLKSTHIPKCDVVTISGDFSTLRHDRQVDLDGPLCRWIVTKFIPWLVSLPCEKVIFIPGNHDFITEQPWFEQWFIEQTTTAGALEKIVYLHQTSYEYKGYTFYGCPTSDIMHWAWCSHGDYTKYKVPTGTDIMLVHQAPDWMDLGVSYFLNGTYRNFGSHLLLNALADEPENLPLLLLCGHIHSGEHHPVKYELKDPLDKTHTCIMANVSSRDEDYQEWFHPRNIIISQNEQDEYIIETWMTPDSGPSDIEEFNKREIFQIKRH